MRRKECPGCQTEFIALRKTARFCSTRCRMRCHRNWKAFESSPLGQKVRRGVTLLARPISVTDSPLPSPSGNDTPPIAETVNILRFQSAGNRRKDSSDASR
jgi:hypothetical protein